MELDERGKLLLDKVQDMYNQAQKSFQITGGYGVSVSGSAPSWVVAGAGQLPNKPEETKLIFNVCHLGFPGTQMVVASFAEAS